MQKEQMLTLQQQVMDLEQKQQQAMSSHSGSLKKSTFQRVPTPTGFQPHQTTSSDMSKSKAPTENAMVMSQEEDQENLIVELQGQVRKLQEMNDHYNKENTKFIERIMLYQEKIKELKGQVQRYQTTYHEIDIGELHRKLTFLESELDIMTRLNTRLSSHVEQQDKVIEDHKKQLKLFRDRERREKEAADRARKELEEFEDVKNNLLNLPDG